MRNLYWLIALASFGCTTNNTSNTFDQGIVDLGPACTPGAKECVSDSLARVCPSDGSGWLSVPCSSGTKCSMGACMIDTSMCTPGTGSCMSASTGLRCMQNGMGYLSVTCPAGTQCVGGGLCAGTCVVGSSLCVSPQDVATCTDGNTATQMICPSGQLCVDTTSDPNLPTAACKASKCMPDPNGCNSICGNKNDATADQTQYVSTCVATPNGYAWLALKCLSPQTCGPTATSCAGAGAAACASQCNPADTRCSPDGSGIQTCSPGGMWGATAACDASKGFVCMNAPGGGAQCGDLICASGAPGTCDASGNFHACDANGRLAATGTACAMGVCFAVGASVNGATPGKCVVECQAGDRRCVQQQDVAFQTCVNGAWSTATTACTGTSVCWDLTNATTGRPDIVCGACQPGSHQCASLDAGPNAGIQTCDPTGNWGATAACSFGSCQGFFNGTANVIDAACVAQCIPGANVCLGPGLTGPGLTIAGTSAQGTCQADGTLPGAPTCPADGTVGGCCNNTGPVVATCRKDVGGNALGCLTCVGATKNENGFIDTACADAAANPGAGNATLLTCAANNTWGAATTCMNGTFCQGASGRQPPSPVQGAYCHACNVGGRLNVCTNSGIAARGRGTCASRGLGAPMSCANPAAGAATVQDCCSNECFADSPATPAFCGIGGG